MVRGRSYPLVCCWMVRMRARHEECPDCFAARSKSTTQTELTTQLENPCGVIVDVHSRAGDKLFFIRVEVGMPSFATSPSYQNPALHRFASELTHQLGLSKELERLHTQVARIPLFVTLYSDETLYDVLAYWKTLRESYDIQSTYITALSAWNSRDSIKRTVASLRVADLLERVSCWEGAIEVLREQIADCVERGDRIVEAKSRAALAKLFGRRAQHKLALIEYELAKQVFQEFGDNEGIRAVLEGMANVRLNLGQMEEAQAHWRQLKVLCTDAGDESGLASLYHNSATLDLYQGKFEVALENLDRAMEINRRTGNRTWLGNNASSLASAYYFQGDFRKSLIEFTRSKEIREGLGDRQGAAAAMGNIAGVYYELGEFDLALESSRKNYAIRVEIGDRDGASSAILNMGNILTELRDWEAAIKSIVIAEAENRDTGARVSLAYSLFGAALSFYKVVPNHTAMPEWLPLHVTGANPDNWRVRTLALSEAKARECVELSKEMNLSGPLFSAQVHLATIANEEADYPGAYAMLEALLHGNSDEAQLANIHFELWGTFSRAAERAVLLLDDHEADAAAKLHHFDEALSRYTQLCENSASIEHRRRLNELESKRHMFAE